MEGTTYSEKIKEYDMDKYVGKEKVLILLLCQLILRILKLHIIPEARGGPTNAENLRPICSCCTSLWEHKIWMNFEQNISPRIRKKEKEGNLLQ